MSSAISEKDISNSEPVNDDSTGLEAINQILQAFNEYLKSKYPEDSSSKVPRPYVYKAKLGIPSADFGISDELVRDGESSVSVIVPHYAHMKVNDTVLLYWDNKLVDNAKVEAGQEGGFVTLTVAEEDIPVGLSTLYCTVTPKHGVAEKSPTVSTLVVYGQPGTEGEQGAGQELAAPLVDLPASGVIGEGEAQAKVKVTVPVYLSMSEHDVIYLYWGDQLITHTVSAEQVGTDVVIEVDEETIRNAGDSDALSVYYYVQDQVGNDSEWSEDTWIKVNLLAGTLDAPAVLAADGTVNKTGEIDLGTYEPDELVIDAVGAFEVGDRVQLYWQGKTAQDQEIPLNLDPQTVGEANQKVQFKVPLSVLSALGQGSARLWYTVLRDGVETHSKQTFLSIKGVAVKLPAPLLDKAEDDWIDADLKYVHAVVPAEAGLQEEDEVTVEWRGTVSDGNVKVRSSKTYRVTKNRLGKLLPFRLLGAQFLKPFDGGFVEVSYSVKRGDLVLYSERSTYYLGYLAETLPAPYTEPLLSNNTLDPTLSAYDFGMEIIIPEGVEQPSPCTVYLYWQTSEGNYYEDEQVLQAGDEVSPFLVPEEQLQVKGDKPVEVEVYYVVSREGKPNLASGDFVFTIATAEMLLKFFAAPVVPLASGGKLQLLQIPAAGLEIQINPYTDMAVGDSIVVKFGSFASVPHVVKSVGLQSIILPFYKIAGLALKNISVLYEVIRVGAEEGASSQVLGLEVVGSAVVPNLDLLSQGKYATGGFNLPSMRIDVLHSFLSIVSYLTNPAWRPVGVKNVLHATYWSHESVERAHAYRITLKTPARKVTFFTHCNRTGSVVAANAQGREVARQAVTYKPTIYSFCEITAPEGESITYLTVISPAYGWLGLGLIVFVN